MNWQGVTLQLGSSTSVVITVPQLITIFIATLTGLGGMTWWFFMTFYQRREAKELEREIRSEQIAIRRALESDSKNANARMDIIQSQVSAVAVDVSYIRGKLEKM